MDGSTRSSSIRFGGVAGLVFVVGLLVLGFTVYLNQPLYNEPVAEIRDHFTDNETLRTVADWIAALLFVGGFLVFASALRSALRPADEDGTWSRVSFAGAVLAIAIAGSGVYLSTFTLGDMAALPDGVVQAFVRADALVYTVLLAWAFAIVLVGASMVMLRGGPFPAWFAWFGFAAAAVNALGALWPVDGDPEGALAVLGYVGFFATMIWIALVAATMTRRQA